MTATDELRRMLSSRGVEFTANDRDTQWWPKDNPAGVLAENSRYPHGTLDVYGLTPEQAIEATLVRDNVGRYVGLRQGEYWERTENSNYYCGYCGWKVTDHDSFCPECGGALHKHTLGSCNCVNSERTGTCRKVYLVETSDDLLESWFPLTVYLHREAAEDCAEALRKENDGILQFARVVELKVVGA